MLSLPPGAIRRLVTDATIDQLFEQFTTPMHEGVFCPVCTRPDRHGVLRPVAASVTGECTWFCHGPGTARRRGCGGGTIWLLRRIILESPEYLARFLDANADDLMLQERVTYGR